MLLRRGIQIRAASYAGTIDAATSLDGLSVGVVAVREPSTYAMAFAGLAIGGYSLFRRRRTRCGKIGDGSEFHLHSVRHAVSCGACQELNACTQAAWSATC